MDLSMDKVRKIINEFFGELSFKEDTHSYHLPKSKLSTSVSGKIEDFYTPFDAVEVSTRIAPYKKTTPEKLQSDWKQIGDDACDLGHKAHSFGELYPFNRKLKPKTLRDEAIVKFWKELPAHIIPVQMEVRMYHKKFLFGGTMDILCYDIKEKHFLIFDYKTNKDLFKNYKGKLMTGIFSHLLDNPFNHYQIQLSYYKILFEQLGYDFKVGGLFLVHLYEQINMFTALPESGEYEVLKVQDFSKELKLHLENNYNG